MPITPEIIAKSEGRISFQKPGEAIVLNGPCSGRKWTEKKIALDGRHYKCAGKIILKNGMELFANLPLRTHTFDFLEKEHVYCLIGDTWYYANEAELLPKLDIPSEEVFPYTWIPDIPLNYRDSGPYPMDWYKSAKAKAAANKTSS
jgi:hypothetical protein